MDLNLMKSQLLRWPLVRRVVLRASMLTIAVIVLSSMQMSHEIRLIDPIMSGDDECSLSVGSNPNLNLTKFMNYASGFTSPLFGAYATECKESESLSKAVFEELMKKKFLLSNTRALCVGKGSSSAVSVLRSLGVVNTFSVDKHPFFSLLKRRFVYELNFEDNQFDFVFSGDLDRVSVPALLVLEIERVLQQGGIGAVLVGAPRFYSGGLVRTVAPIASFLKSSDVIHLCSVGSFSLMIFKKRFDTFVSFEHFRLPADCPSLARNKPLMKYIEPLGDKSLKWFEPELSYLPNFMNISSRNRLVYMNIGAGEFVNASVAKMSELYQSHNRASFDVFIVDHKTSALSSYVTKPGINFVYHPALAGDATSREISSDEQLAAPMHEEAFDFIGWFKATVSVDDFVVLMMNARPVEVGILVELFKTGGICLVDEMFLRCSDTEFKTGRSGYCLDLFKSLRKSSVYVHQWFGDRV